MSEPRTEAEGQQELGLDQLPVSPAIGCLAALLLSLLGVLLIFLVVKLMVEGELRMGGGPLTPNRVWLLREGDNRGFGWSSGRVLDELSDDNRRCVDTSVRYLLWRSDETAQPVDYCECYLRAGDGWQYEGVCPEGNQGGEP